MSGYQYKFVGRDSLPRSLSQQDVQQHCGLLPEHIAAIKQSNVALFDGRDVFREESTVLLHVLLRQAAGQAVASNELVLVARHRLLPMTPRRSETIRRSLHDDWRHPRRP